MDDKIKILFIHHSLGWCGAFINMVNIINSLDKEKFNIQVLLLKNSVVTDRLREAGIEYYIAKSKFYKVYYLYFMHSEANSEKWYHMYKFIQKYTSWLFSRYYFSSKELKYFSPDIIFLNSSVLTDWLAPVSKKAKVIIHIQEPFRKRQLDFLHVFFIHQMKKYANHIIAISKDNSRRIGITDKTTVIYNFITLPQNSPPQNSYYSKKVLYLGGSSEVKGFYTIVDAIKYLDKDVIVFFGGSYSTNNCKRRTFKNYIKMLTGIGRKKDKYLEIMRKSPNVNEIGLLNNVDDRLQEVCCIVSPFSKPHFSRPVIEAYLHKKPAIVTDVEGMEEIVFHGDTGLIVPDDDPKSLAESINFIANTPQKAKEMGEKGYHFAIEKFYPDNIKILEGICYNLIYK